MKGGSKMLIELGISSFDCDCRCMIYPPSSISTKLHKKHIEKIELPITHTKIAEEKLLTKKLYDEIQAGLYDSKPDLARFKGKLYAECVKIRRAEYKTWRDEFVTVKRAEADTKETELKKNAKNVTKAESEEAITIEAERFEATIEGDEKEGRALCPKCGKELVSWRT